jgi:hypothetical protein
LLLPVAGFVTINDIPQHWKAMDFDKVLVNDNVREEEEIIDRYIKDICNHLASEKRSTIQSGLNHCSHFLKSYCAKEKIKYM